MSNIIEILPAQVIRYHDEAVKPYLPKSKTDHIANIKRNAADTMSNNRKINSNAHPKDYERYLLTQSEYKIRGIRFLPRQVLNKIFRAHGIN